MALLLVILVLVALAAIIGNQYSVIKKMDSLQKTLDDINQKIKKEEHQL